MFRPGKARFTPLLKINRHHRTNMATAAKNMLTHISPCDLAKDGKERFYNQVQPCILNG